MNLPNDIDSLRERVQKILDPIVSAVDKGTKAEKDFLFTASRTDAGRGLPSYYLVYFLFVDLLGYKNLGQFEKVAWSVPIDYNGTAYLLEHRKMGMGLFAADKEKQEGECQEIVKKIKKAAKAAQPYFEWIANEAAKQSKLNVLNHSLRLHDRYSFLESEHKKKLEEAISRKDERIKTQHSENSWSVRMPYYELKRESEWLALSAIDAFYSFTEHVFIHAAILKGHLLTGEDVANLADKDWASKFKACLDVQENSVKPHYDKLVAIKRQIRNYMAHGAFGKNGEAFQIHSGAGAVPLLMPHQKGSSRFSMQSGTEFQEEEAISAIEEFMRFYWESNDFPEVMYIKSTLPSILTYASDATYKNAMASTEDMESFVDYLIGVHDRAGDMDW
ncbi:hypothetical protein [Halothiobacillus neapolitanus]|uniref:Uncharacterized protein n=1 Tax=Halothiobacillus neapolitanus (strain ATCC 23641 / DSM 15147 / CIP 104769 / NCIMB 8539 / c2) TaxID=555778 RepID=D0KWG9_HALNC|nr:hypothetical protein [Halothiobacillus neapolitanus]ACX94966.1 conserved hypothetical protein [Halothiobacillus neapolitanus c2]TDN61083.1 hypothetical protein C8D83_103216 [Halothiobacillus neapolitanus]